MSGMMDCCGLTDIGKKRSVNEDQFLISDVRKSMRVHQTSLALDHQTRLFGGTQGNLLLVADGMGGHEAGERASQLVIDGFVDYTLNHLSWFMHESCESDEDFEQQLKTALVNCQKRLDREIAAIPQRRGMGSTLTLGYIVWPRMFLVHVGDSRCYLLRDGKLQQLTRDHTLAALAAASAGRQSEDEQDDDELTAERPMSNVLWNAIGGGRHGDLHPDASAMDLQMGDTLMFCTDGLTKHVSKKKIHEILSQNVPTDAMCEQLVALANDAGGTDNCTVVISRFADRSEVEGELAEVEIPLNVSDSLGLADTVDMIPTDASRSSPDRPQPKLPTAS